MYTVQYYSAKREQDNAFEATWMELETHNKWKKSEREIPYNITYIWNLINGTNESIYIKETYSWTWRIDLQLPRGGEEWDGLGVWGL